MSENTKIKEKSKEAKNVMTAYAIVLLIFFLSLFIIVIIPAVNSLTNNKPSAQQEINNYLKNKGQKLAYSEQEPDLTWTIIAFDDKKIYHYSFSKDGKQILSSYSKRSNFRPYLDFSRYTNETINYPKVNVEKKENTTIYFFYDPNDAEGYVNAVITALLRDALPNTEIREYCYGETCPYQNQTKTEIENIFKNLNTTITLPAIIINNKTILNELIGTKESNIKTRFLINLKYFCQYIKGEPKCEE